jgi:hypothetical protein
VRLRSCRMLAERIDPQIIVFRFWGWVLCFACFPSVPLSDGVRIRWEIHWVVEALLYPGKTLCFHAARTLRFIFVRFGVRCCFSIWCLWRFLREGELPQTLQEHNIGLWPRRANVCLFVSGLAVCNYAAVYSMVDAISLSLLRIEVPGVYPRYPRCLLPVTEIKTMWLSISILFYIFYLLRHRIHSIQQGAGGLVGGRMGNSRPVPFFKGASRKKGVGGMGRQLTKWIGGKGASLKMGRQRLHGAPA